MNNTDKAKYDVARRMLKGHIDVEEVAIMTGISLDEIKKLNDEINPPNSEAELLKKYDTTDLDIGEILIDNLPTNAGFDAELS